MARDLFVGLMSGTSLDGVDAVVADFAAGPCRILAAAHAPFEASLRAALLELQAPGFDELARAALASNRLAETCAQATLAALSAAGVGASEVRAIGSHGQTVRHRPELGFTVQLDNPALLAELTGIAVVADFRSRDVAAGGQGAPLVPAFHAALFGRPDRHVVVLNLGGIANLTDLPPGATVRGWDTGPGNVLLDAWCARHLGEPFDRDGRWASSGRVLPELLDRLLAEPYFERAPPKSTGRDLFNPAWLEARLSGGEATADVQATLVALTAQAVARELRRHCAGADELLLCGGGARNAAVVEALARELRPLPLESTASRGVPVDQVEALAFAWLAWRTLAGEPGSLAAVTGARGPRVLGAVYPA